MQLLAKLSGYVEHKGRRPGKIVLLRGLRRLMEMVATEALLSDYYREQGAFPPRIAAFLRGWRPAESED